MSNDLQRLALELIAERGPEARFFWVDKNGGRHERKTVSDLARAALADEIDPDQLASERRLARR